MNNAAFNICRFLFWVVMDLLDPMFARRLLREGFLCPV